MRPIEAIIPGAQGRVLAVLTQTTAELNLRTVAQLAGVSLAQASRLLPELVELGVVERREVPPSSLFRLVPEHVTARALLDIARSSDRVLSEVGDIAAALPVAPRSAIVFGSVARREARADSDIDLVLVRPDPIDEDDAGWATSVEQLRSAGRLLTGNVIEVLEASEDEARAKLTGRSALWHSIKQEGIVVHGASLEELTAKQHA